MQDNLPLPENQLLSTAKEIIQYIAEITAANTNQIDLKVPHKISLSTGERREILLLCDNHLAWLEKRYAQIQKEGYTEENDTEEEKIQLIIRILTTIANGIGYDESSFSYSTTFKSEKCTWLIEQWNRAESLRNMKEEAERERPAREADSMIKIHEQIGALTDWSNVSQEAIDVLGQEILLEKFKPLFNIRWSQRSEIPGWRKPAWELMSKIMKRPDFESHMLPKIQKDKTINLDRLFTINEYFDMWVFLEKFAQPQLPLFIAKILYSEIYYLNLKQKTIDPQFWDMLEPYREDDNLSIDKWGDISPRYVFPRIFWS